MKRFLIVNADDCNLTPGVTRAILDCHDHGILTSTTFLVNLPCDSTILRDIRRRKNLGVGIHWNVTLGNPVSPRQKAGSLLRPDGSFKKYSDQMKGCPRPNELAAEYEAQLALFQKIFGRMPTHIDTHHQVHDRPFFLKVVAALAQKYRLPLRRSQLFSQGGWCAQPKIKTTNYFFGNLTPQGHWREASLRTILEFLPVGTSEIMTHPGRNDAGLRQVSSFTAGREVEWKLFRSLELRKFVERQGITLAHYGML